MHELVVTGLGPGSDVLAPLVALFCATMLQIMKIGIGLLL
jgi:hypothetical protein